METVVGRRATEGVVVAHVQLDIILSDAAEVRVVATGRNRANVVLRRSHRACDEGVDAIGADHDSGVLLDGPSISSVASNTHDDVAGHEQLVDGKALPNVDAGLRRGIHQETVEHGAARTESAHAIVRVRNGAAQRERADVERHVPADGWCACRRQPAEKTPPRQDLGAVRPEDVCRDRIAGEGGSVDEQHLEPLPCEEHCRRGARTPRADDDGVVHLASAST